MRKMNGDQANSVAAFGNSWVLRTSPTERIVRSFYLPFHQFMFIYKGNVLIR